jgi:hypothetical protein
MKTLAKLSILLVLGLTACVSQPELPPQYRGELVPVAPGDPEYGNADLSTAVKPAGAGGVSEGLVVRATADIPVYRLWSGPDVMYGQYTNRQGRWWSADTPHGSVVQYRIDYEICGQWNTLAYGERCTLKKGAVVAIGPGQSVSAETCKDPSGKYDSRNESYPASPAHWQIYIKDPGNAGTLACPEPSQDYKADLLDISPPKSK